MRIFYHPITFENTLECVLPEVESKHICKVLRMQVGDRIVLINGKGAKATASILDNHHKRCLIQIEEVQISPKENYHIHIAVAPTKNMDRMEWMVEKLTELGVHEISFILTQNCERKHLKLDRLIKIAIAAMKQSQRHYLPTLHPLTSLSEFILKHSKCGIAYCAEVENKLRITSLTKQELSQLPILIGPEGDFTPEEITMMNKSQNLFLNLGDTRLRTETAALFAGAVLKSKLEHD